MTDMRLAEDIAAVNAALGYADLVYGRGHTDPNVRTNLRLCLAQARAAMVRIATASVKAVERELHEATIVEHDGETGLVVRTAGGRVFGLALNHERGRDVLGVTELDPNAA